MNYDQAALIPEGLRGKHYEGAHFCDEWELRITERCLEEDFGAPPDADFAHVARRAIVKRFVNERCTSTEGTRDVNGLRSGKPVYVLTAGQRTRGGTWFDEQSKVIWLVAVHRHSSGSNDDFFPHCQGLDEARRLFPLKSDYNRMLDERGTTFAQAVRLEAPTIHKAARKTGAELAKLLGGVYQVSVQVIVEDGIEQTYVAVEPGDGAIWEHLSMILAAFRAPGDEWSDAQEMPDRQLAEGEIAFLFFHEP